MLKRIRIQGYKSFRDLDLELGPLCVLIGPNSSGKSNFLDALQLLSNLPGSDDLNQVFEQHRGSAIESLFCGDVGLQGVVAGKGLGRMSFEVQLECSKRKVQETLGQVAVDELLVGEDFDASVAEEVVQTAMKRYQAGELRPDLRYRLELSYDEQKRRVDLAEEELSGRGGPEQDWDSIALPREQRAPEGRRGDASGAGSEESGVLLRVQNNRENHCRLLMNELSDWRTFSLNATELCQPQLSASRTLRLGQDGTNLVPVLYTLKRDFPTEFEMIKKTVRGILPSGPTIDVEMTEDAQVKLYVEESGVQYQGKLISEGTARLLALVTALMLNKNAGLIAYEEPENGLHPVRVQFVAELLKNASRRHGIQVVVTTHSPLFASYFDTDQLYVCRRDGAETKIEHMPEADILFDPDKIETSLQKAFVRGDFGG